MTVFGDLPLGHQWALRKTRRFWGHWPYLAALKLDDGSLLFIATQSTPHSAIADRAQRWNIETFFCV